MENKIIISVSFLHNSKNIYFITPFICFSLRDLYVPVFPCWNVPLLFSPPFPFN